MSFIKVLDEPTINKIAAGEVVERPRGVVKELLENAIDAGSTAITVEIKEGGLSLIRITDNGGGISKKEIPLAFLRHATSKIRTAQDLFSVTSLGFRGEALSSIAAVSQVELITKNPSSLNGYRYIIEGGEEKSLEEIGCPDGTTIIVRNIFFNTPARRKFLKSPGTEASYISELMEKLLLSHPDISFKYIVNNKIRLQSSGNSNIKDVLYQIYGRDITKELLSVDFQAEGISIKGFIGKPIINRSNRNFENYFINGRYIKSKAITSAIEEAYRPFLMQHKYPLTSLYYQIDPSNIDVNVHPQKLEIRFRNNKEIMDYTSLAISSALSEASMIPKVTLTKEKEEKKSVQKFPEPFEVNRRKEYVNQDKPLAKDTPILPLLENESLSTERQVNLYESSDDNQLSFLKEEELEKHRIIGQVFATYWMVEYKEELFIIDQHAAHEKVLYERMIAGGKEKTYSSQRLMPAIVLTLTLKEQEIINKHSETLTKLGYEIQHFGGNEYAVQGVPADLYGLSDKDLILEFIDNLAEDYGNPSLKSLSIIEKIASFSCKAAVKGNHSFSMEEANELIKELLTLDNPYHCPHGRPVIISISKYQFEKKFKRIV